MSHYSKFVRLDVLEDMRVNSNRQYTPQTYRSNQSQSNASEMSDVSFFLFFENFQN